VLMLGADGVWLGTRFVATTESGVSDAYRARLVASSADDTILTDVFDAAVGMPWPAGVSGRAIANQFSQRWHGNEDALRAWADEHRDEYLALGPDAEVDNRPIWAGEAASLVNEISSAGDVVAELAAEAAEVLSSRTSAILRNEEV
jgi:nitronate monooxygenase